jgi:hypothetical protein
MRFDEFKTMIERDRPASLHVGLVAKVKPAPWILRAGHGNEARIRMIVAGEHRYERSQGDDEWTRVEQRGTEFDLLDDGA